MGRGHIDFVKMVMVTKMAASLYMVKTLKIFFSRTGSHIMLKLGMQHQGLKLYKVCINGDLGLTLTNIMARSN